MRKAAVLILMAAVMGGCGSTHAKRYFQIRSVAADEPALPKVERRLLVEPASVDPLYDDIRILFRVSAFELKYYPYEFWAERPGRQVGATMAEFLVKKKVFPSVGVGGKGLNESPDIVLRSGIHVLEEIDNPRGWEARLAMTIEFVDARTGATIVARNFDRKEPMLKQVGDLPGVVSRIVDEELAKAVWDLARALEKK
jgi:ABC-type uncharacterized transport system auxiliary subunit